MLDGRRQPSVRWHEPYDGVCHVRFCEGFEVKFPGAYWAEDWSTNLGGAWSDATTQLAPVPSRRRAGASAGAHSHAHGRRPQCLE